MGRLLVWLQSESVKGLCKCKVRESCCRANAYQRKVPHLPRIGFLCRSLPDGIQSVLFFFWCTARGRLHWIHFLVCSVPSSSSKPAAPPWLHLGSKRFEQANTSVFYFQNTTDNRKRISLKAVGKTNVAVTGKFWHVY